MNKHVSYTWVGVFVILLASIFICLVIWLSALKDHKDYDKYVVYARGDVAGLSVSSAVRYNGVQVGAVVSVKINDKDPQEVIIVLNVQEGTPITTSTVAIVESEGITGVQYVGLKSLTSNAPALTKKAGQEYPVIAFEPSLFMKLSAALQMVTTQIENLSESVGKVFSDKNQKSLSNTLENIDVLTTHLAKDGKKIDSIIMSTDKLLLNTAKASARLPATMRKLDKTLESLSGTARQVKRTAGKVSDVLDNADAILQAALQQVVPELQQFLGSLDSIGDNVAVITSEMKDNPAVILRGKLPARPGPGEKR